jgi:hypothetical protein
MQLFEQLMKYEQGDMTHEEMLDLFSRLIETGLAWTLQGSYGRTARDLISNGFIDMAGNILIDLQELD